MAKEADHSREVIYAWTLVFALCGIGALYFLAVYRWHAERPMHGGGAPSLPVLTVALDYLFGYWLILPILLLITFVSAAIVSGHAFLGSLSRVRRVAYACSETVTALGALAIVVMSTPTILSIVARSALCETTTFTRSVSPNARYQATVIQIDCGAMSSDNRQLVLTRIPFFWASQSIMAFTGEPTLHLSWQGRMLTVQGSRSPLSFPHPPPDPMVWGGIMIRYVGEEGAGPAKEKMKSGRSPTLMKRGFF